MKITLTNTYIDREDRLADIERQLAVIDKKLKTPAWTLEDVIRHIELLKERNKLI